MLEAVQTFVTICATGVGSYVALAGLQAWKREHTGKRDIELCQQVIESFYEAEQNIKVLRSPMSYPEQESAERPKRNNEPEDERRLRDTHYVPLARLTNQNDFWTIFFAQKFKMRAIFGDTAAEPFALIDEALRSFRAAAVVRYQSIQGNRLELNNDLSRQFDEALWEVGDDALGEKVRESINKMEDICAPIVRSAHGKAGWSWLRGSGRVDANVPKS